jgi:hypothetical protein
MWRKKKRAAPSLGQPFFHAGRHASRTPASLFPARKKIFNTYLNKRLFNILLVCKLGIFKNLGVNNYA